MVETGKKPTDVNTDAKRQGQIIINVYDDSFDVSATENLTMQDVYAVSIGILEYLEFFISDVDKPEKSMLQ